jgi:hypothetical protein
VPGRTINAAAYADGENMTIENCIAYCAERNFAYAGTEWSIECFCGSELAAGTAQVSDAECNMPCSGDSSQPCGAGQRLTLFHTDNAPPGPEVNPGVNGYEYIGCYAEGTTGRALTYAAPVPGNEMTVDKCTAACHAANYILAGVEYSGECFCDNSIQNGGALANEGCTMLCNGNQSEYCGGPNRLNVYAFGGQFEAPTTTSSAAASTSTAAGPSHPEEVGDYTFYGCYTDSVANRALNGAFWASGDMTLEACAAFCSGYTYFGTEYSTECFCGNSFNGGSTVAPTSQCNMLCGGNTGTYCGAANRLSVYSLNGSPPQSSSAPATTSSAPATSSTSAVPAPSGLPDGWSYQGCWVDNAQGRILPHQVPDPAGNTLAVCANLCKDLGYTIAGVEYSVQCFCGNAIHNGGEQAPENQCNMPCPGDATQKCGDGNRLNIASLGTPDIYQPPAPIEQVGDWEYQGCLEDNLGDQRTFPWQLFFPGTMTPELCLNRCKQFGYAAAGLEYGEECYCGDPENIATRGATFTPESECAIPCAGNPQAICGGLSRMTTYFWTGEPLYEWDFPQDWRAGQYQFLVDGVTIPLITQETITGKVSFISKHGTGPGNETGAYEYDPVLNSFRELHLKTDVFCAAGVTLPDKAGRQLNVGGWSGDSTYGTRLYWPDGTPGTWGTHDWQENVNVLSLQEGRWYPTALVLTNGSILVIGGSIGSNDAATPTLEILPHTGTPPLYMEWLDRTHPNNLYPFLAILPSGGIFVQYWNEARILDPVTFDTIKVLPNAPGAVNNDLGGRTYPLEGTMVLLPQKAPYTDPLGVLICGGSVDGPATALDNCVSIYPDAPNPTWTIERMPSKRVLTCMAPLPDGTYLIINGAHHGVAGFGLANQPNYNAVLYDPEKPVHKRMSVLANTTIARMYHSEAITLLDGRVLVSGSNPEDGVHPEEYRVEVFLPPYLTSGKARPTFTLNDKDWEYDQQYTFSLGGPAQHGDITVTLLGSVSSTHGNSMGARTLMPAVSCSGTSCTVTAPPNANIAPPGWYQFFVLDGGIPAVGVYVRIGGDPAGLGNWPQHPDFSTPGI